MIDFLSLFSAKRRRLKVRNVLFGDLPVAHWPSAAVAADHEPWLSFVQARDHWAAKRKDRAIELYRQILAMPGLESRHYLQAWQFLREADIEPDDSVARTVYGVVMEVNLPQGLDLLAAYADGSARYFNHSGKGIVWDAPDASLAKEIDALLKAGRTVADQVGPWQGIRPEIPPKKQARINVLTPGGLRFGQAPFEVLAQDALGKVVAEAASVLMQRLIDKTKK